MQALNTLLRKLAVVTQHIAAMQNQQVAYYLASQLKSAATFSSVDYVDIADTCAKYATMTKDLCSEDIQKLKAIVSLLYNANIALHQMQDILLNAERIENAQLPS